MVPDHKRWGPAKDFFEDRDKQFVEHRRKLLEQVDGIKSSFQRSGMTSGILKVKDEKGSMGQESPAQPGTISR